MHSFTSLTYHIVFSTKRRFPFLTSEIRKRLFPYISAMGKNLEINIQEIGGVEDHVHILVSIPAKVPVAKAVQLLKTNSSKWINETYSVPTPFSWQDGYAAFSIGISGVAKTKEYILNQEEHHKREPFLDEFRRFLKKHGFAQDEGTIGE